jgi:hypothetical protein
VVTAPAYTSIGPGIEFQALPHFLRSVAFGCGALSLVRIVEELLE